MIPTTYEQWKNCIVNDCGIKLSRDFVSDRLKVYENMKHPETKKFIKLYGEQHLNNIIYWFQTASEEMGQRTSL